MRDLDWGDVYADAMSDPTLDRPCEEGAACVVPRCPLVHPEPEATSWACCGVALVDHCQC